MTEQWRPVLVVDRYSQDCQVWKHNLTHATTSRSSFILLPARSVMQKLTHFTVSTRNTLDCDQSNYSSRIVLSHIPFNLVKKELALFDPPTSKTPNVEPNMKWIGRPLAEIWPFEISPIWAKCEVVGRRSSVAGRRSVLNIYFFLHCSHILLFATLGM